MHLVDRAAGLALRCLPHGKLVFADGWGDEAAIALLDVTAAGQPQPQEQQQQQRCQPLAEDFMTKVLRLVANLLGVNDRDSNLARRRVEARRG